MIIFLHGFLGAPSDWDDVIRELPGIECIALSIPGHGDAPDAECSIRRVFDDVRDAIGAARGRAHLVGYSMGGRLLLSFAMNHPDWVRSLTMCSSTPGLGGEADRAARRAADECWAKRLESEPAALVMEEWYAQPIFASLAEKPELLGVLKRERAAQNGSGPARAMRIFGTGVMPDLWPDLPRFAMPVMWVAGEGDPKYVDIARRASALSPRGSASIVPRSGHALHREQPAAVAARIRQFIEEQADGGNQVG